MYRSQWLFVAYFTNVTFGWRVTLFRTFVLVHAGRLMVRIGYVPWEQP
jgi:hypothetical protein